MAMHSLTSSTYITGHKLSLLFLYPSTVLHIGYGPIRKVEEEEEDDDDDDEREKVCF